jgi:hypothetical protein
VSWQYLLGSVATIVSKWGGHNMNLLPGSVARHPMWHADFTVALAVAGGVLFALGLTALYLLQKFLI